MLGARTALIGLGLLLVATAGCGRIGYREPAADTRGMDAAVGIDAGAIDAGATDAGAIDAGGPDDATITADGGPDAAPGDAGDEQDAGAPPVDAGTDASSPDAGVGCQCTPGETRSCGGCGAGPAVQTCEAACFWGACVDTAGDPCGACDDGAFFCRYDVGRSFTCEGGRWRCTCSCSGGAFCC